MDALSAVEETRAAILRERVERYVAFGQVDANLCELQRELVNRTSLSEFDKGRLEQATSARRALWREFHA